MTTSNDTPAQTSGAGAQTGHTGAVKSPTELEADILRQEHRAVFVVLNFWRRRQWDHDDPRRAAAVAALVWSFLSPSSVAVAGGGIAALATVLILLHQNTLLTGQNERFDKQNELIAEQNSYFRTQNEAIREQISTAAQLATKVERADLIRTLYSPSEQAPARQRAEALLAFLALERLRRADDGPEFLIDLGGANLSGTRLSREDLSYCDLRNADLRHAHWTAVSLYGSVLGPAQIEGTHIIGDFREVQLDEFPLPDLIYDLPESFRGKNAAWYDEMHRRARYLTQPGRLEFDAVAALAELSRDAGFEWRTSKGLDPELPKTSPEFNRMLMAADFELRTWLFELCPAFVEPFNANGDEWNARVSLLHDHGDNSESCRRRWANEPAAPREPYQPPRALLRLGQTHGQSLTLKPEFEWFVVEVTETGFRASVHLVGLDVYEE